MPHTNFDPKAPPETEFVQRYLETERTRRKHIAVEAAIKTIAVLYMISAAGLLLAGGIVVFAAVKSAVAQSALLRLVTEPAFIIGWLILIAGWAFLSVGIGLRRFRPWARWICALLTLLGIGSNVATMLFFHSTSIALILPSIMPSIMLLLLLLPKTGRIFSPSYHHTVEQTPHIRLRVAEAIYITLIVLLAIAATIAPTALGSLPDWPTIRASW